MKHSLEVVYIQVARAALSAQRVIHGTNYMPVVVVSTCDEYCAVRCGFVVRRPIQHTPPQVSGDFPRSYLTVCSVKELANAQ